MNESNNPSWEDVQLAFVEEWEQGATTGTRPALGDYLRRYPQYAAELTDFALEYAALEHSTPAVNYDTTLSPEAVRAGDRVRETLGWGEYAADAETEPTFAELMREAGATIVKLKNALAVPPLLINKMQNGLLSDWSGTLLRRVGEAMDRTESEVAAALAQSLQTKGSLATAHFKATGGNPDAQAVEGTPKTLAETLDELGFSPEQKAQWLADE